MRKLFFLLLTAALLQACSTDEASHQERTTAAFLGNLGDGISTTQWWRTAVAIVVNVATDGPTKVALIGMEDGKNVLYDLKEVSRSGSVVMTAPQGQPGQLYLCALCGERMAAKAIMLTGKTEEMASIDVMADAARQAATRAPWQAPARPASLCGNSINGDASYYRFTDDQLADFFSMMEISRNNTDAKVLDMNTNYELKSHGPFYITWVNGYEGSQTSRILGYYHHAADSWADIEYVDLSETHKWDYIDGLAKVQYQISRDDEVDGHLLKAHTWYDANFDLSDKYGATWCYNNDRVGDDAYNSQVVYERYGSELTALRGISFKISVPENRRIGFYLRSEADPMPEQWDILQLEGIKPYTSNRDEFKGTCFCAEFMNVEGNGLGQHRSFIKDYDEVIWMGMEDLINGGDHDCNDVIFGVVSDLEIFMPEIVQPGIDTDTPDPGPDTPDPGPDTPDPGPDTPDPGPDTPDPGPDTPDPDGPTASDVSGAAVMPWTIAYEDVNRQADFDFNDAVIKLTPYYESELCCVTVMAAGATSRMYLHYDGPDGDQNLGEIHELLGSRSYQSCINTTSALANQSFVQVDCVPWPKGYTMAKDAQRFYIEIQRGTCNDCTDVITLPQAPGQMPEALLVAGEWKWPMEGVHILDTYGGFHSWAHDVTRTRFWEWYRQPALDFIVNY